MKIDKLLQDFLFHCKFEKNLNPKTIAAYTMDIEQFKTFKDIKSMNINEVDKDILKEYIQYLYTLELKPKSIKRKLATLKAFFTHLEFEEIITISPFRKMRISIKEHKILPNIHIFLIFLKYLYHKKMDRNYKYKLFDAILVYSKDRFINILPSTNKEYEEVRNYFLDKDLGNIKDKKIFIEIGHLYEKIDLDKHR
ncbi:tyrosine-type recombinase/integrase [Aliarcobacter butzleri]|uniref:tyrosine-type recombinase/integrase n=1 Tax=Aliarcobacter butzleri TaxID=28197 RepID=UPI0021B2810A|nr:site-specific integrase [Aliarcobacter butzleri]MCT7586821.1 site-specific integrase [Aliarcobacter butzleri]